MIDNIRILYWNVDNNQTRLKLALENKERYEVVAIQELPRDVGIGVPKYLKGGRYEIIYSRGRVILYISKEIDRRTQTVERETDQASITIREGTKVITIYTIYLERYKQRGQTSPLVNLLQKALSGRDILVGDINMYYPIQDRKDRIILEVAYLLRLADAWNLDLYTLRGELIRRGRRIGERDGTIDYIQVIQNLLVVYNGTEDYVGSDHIP